MPAGSRTDEGVLRPSQFGITDYEDLRLPTPDGETLSAFFIRPSNKGRAKNITILMFHGNAGNIGHRVPIAKFLEENSACNIFMLEYRGYGLSSGTPNEQGLMIDAQTALEYIRRKNETRHNRIIVFGQSLGGAVAIQLVAKNQEAGDIDGLILENTFTSMRKLIPRSALLAGADHPRASLTLFLVFSRLLNTLRDYVISIGQVRMSSLKLPKSQFCLSAVSKMRLFRT